MKHTVHVTNYQQHLDANPLLAYILENIPEGVADSITDAMHASIAYVTVNKVRDPRKLHETVLALSIVGKTYRYKYMHGVKELYDAAGAIAAGKASNTQIKAMQDTFETLVFLRGDKIVADLLKAYNIKTV